MKKIVAITLLALLVGCSGKNQTCSVVDVAKPETITLAKLSSQGNIHSITIVGKGRLDGTAEIVLILNGKPYKTEKLSGDVDFKWRADWYSDSASIVYTPSSAKAGNVNLHYRFEDI